ncbi:uncharacterized protein LOC122393654 [Amphibalanus amphitrite]|uniref:uncharacterized protein LOC122393654 n=1 Tax=Amphibalanus amphitrite TaxID=1232801 RepID=UPI001C90719D|nr:uncharacterized protein LOC122393654 [Amphibalanus amphitrite]XP_043245812.1 uncharacterized protein LOC122393654 [Amphibalanus amphitrite]
MNDSAAHVRTSLEELSCVVTTTGWPSLRLRALGWLRGYQVATNSGYLESVGEPLGPHTVPVDLRLVDSPPANKLVEVFGELQIVDGRPCILAKFFSEADGVDATLYHRATQKLADRYPQIQR